MRFNVESIAGLIGLLMALVPAFAVGQSPVLFHLTSNDPDAAVYADSLYIGLVNQSPFWVDPNTSSIRLTTLRGGSWSVRPIKMRFEPAYDDTVYAHLNFPMYHQIESHPLAAKVWLQSGIERRFLGVTPMVFSSEELRDSTFIVEHDGYLSKSIEPKMDIWNRYMTSLTLLTQEKSLSTVNTINRQRRQWIDWSIAIVGVAAGVAAVHYKFRADKINDNYLETGDPSLRPRVARLDDYSGIALGVMQAGAITLAVRFALR